MDLDVIYQTDAISGLKSLDSNSVDCIVTSPPYWQLRDYGLEPILFGGNTICSHSFDRFNRCAISGGWLGQLGQEPVREMFIEHLLTIFDECRRVLKQTGTLWVNLSDSYSKPYKYNRTDNKKWGVGKNEHCYTEMRVDLKRHRVPSKSLCNIPGRFAEEMIQRGWIMRNEIIWHKPSVIPCNIKDRFTVDFEKLFFFTQSHKYLFEQQFEPYASDTPERYSRTSNLDTAKNGLYKTSYNAPRQKLSVNPKGRNLRTVWRLKTANSGLKHFAAFPAKLIERPILAGSPVGGVVLDPFMGSGTTAVVAKRLGRYYIGIEPNPEYVSIINQRLKTEPAILKQNDEKENKY